MKYDTAGYVLAAQIEALLDQEDIFVPSEVGDELTAMLRVYNRNRDAGQGGL